MTSHTAYLTFNTERRREFVRITEDVDQAVLSEQVIGFVLKCARRRRSGIDDPSSKNRSREPP